MGDYTIKRGDTLSALAQRFHTTVDALAKANDIKNPNLIYAGAKLRIPDGFETGASRTSGSPSHGRDSFSPAPRGAPTSGPVAAPTDPAPAGQVGDWINQARAALTAAGIPADKMNASDIALIIQHESGGNPTIQNNWDSNAKAGHPSIGLMQTIQPTFDAYKLPGHNDIRNPVDNIIAGVRYAIARYGSISNVPGVVAVHQGRSYVGY